MTLCLKIKKEQGELARKFLLQNRWLDLSKIIGKSGRKFLLLPMMKEAEISKIIKKFPDAKMEERNLEKVAKRAQGSLKELVAKVASPKVLEKLRRSYDVVGDIAVLEVPPELRRMEKAIAGAILRAHPGIKVVAKKAGAAGGKFRVRPIEIILGDNRTTTIHKEFGVKLELNLNKVYFSPRLGNERLRIAKLVKKGENVLVMFAGVGPYPLVIAKLQPKCKVWAVELNPIAAKYMLQNVLLNKMLDQITAVEGDVRKVVPHLDIKFDRIIMVLPNDAEKFLDIAFCVAKKGTIIHVYQFAKDNEIPKAVSAKVLEEVHKLKKRVKVLKVVICGAYSPKVERVCLDLEVAS